MSYIEIKTYPEDNLKVLTTLTNSAPYIITEEDYEEIANITVQKLSPTLDEKTVKTRIDYNDATKTFSVDGSALNYKELHDIHLVKSDFGFVVYGDRAYLLSYVQDDAGQMREMRFQSVIAVTGSDNISNVKTSGIYVTSNDGINIASVRVVDINSENEAYKADEITDANKNSTIWYPSNKAVTTAIEDTESRLSESIGNIKETIDEIVIEHSSTNVFNYQDADSIEDNTQIGIDGTLYRNMPNYIVAKIRVSNMIDTFTLFRWNTNRTAVVAYSTRVGMFNDNDALVGMIGTAVTTATPTQNCKYLYFLVDKRNANISEVMIIKNWDGTPFSEITPYSSELLLDSSKLDKQIPTKYSELLNDANYLSFVDFADLSKRMVNGKSFSWKQRDSAYITIVFDDGNDDVNTVLGICNARNIPVCVAIPTDKLPNIKTMCDSVVASGGEILSHSINSAVLESATNYEQIKNMLGKSKKDLTDAGYVVRGFIRPGGVGAVDWNGNNLQRFTQLYYDYSDRCGDSPNYFYPRSNIDGKSIDTLKSLVNQIVASNGWMVTMGHKLDKSGFLSSETFAEFLDYALSQGVKFRTYAYMYDTFGQWS